MRTIKRRLDLLKSRIVEPDSQAKTVKLISALMDELSAAAAGGEAQAEHTLAEILDMGQMPQRRDHPPSMTENPIYMVAYQHTNQQTNTQPHNLMAENHHRGKENGR